MLLSDLTVEVRDTSLARIGQFVATDLVGFTMVSRFNAVGSWSMKLPANHRLGELLRQPGYGIIVTGPNGVILSGPTTSATNEQTYEDPDGMWTISGVDDSVYLIERLAYPTPATDDVTAQTSAYDTRSGLAESVIKGFVNANIGPSAPASRRVSGLTIQTDGGRGTTVSASARFDVLQDLLYPLAQTGGIGYDIRQVGTGLQFEVFQPTDRSSLIRMDIANGKLTKTDYGYYSPKVTRTIVAGQGEAEARTFIEASNAASLTAEGLWKRRIELYRDDRGSDTTDKLAQTGAETLIDNGKTIVNVAVTPSDDTNMRYGIDWGLGDKVTVVVGVIEASAVVNEVGVGIAEDGVRIYATLGTPTYTDTESRIIARATQQELRIANLEKNGASASTAWIAVTSFSNSWTATTPVFYRKLNGVIYLRGALTGGTTGTAFTLPAGFTPVGGGSFVVANGSSTTPITITSAGAVQLVAATTPTLNLSFPSN
jgi:Siphovirus ReqiPepy6 Gp37-like protein